MYHIILYIYMADRINIKYFFLFIIIALVVACSPVSAWDVDISITSGERASQLSFGVEAGSAAEFDDHDLPLPPAPPDATFDAWFEAEGLFERLMKDIRPEPGWILTVSSDSAIDVSWEKPPVPLDVSVAGEIVNMQSETGVTLGAGEHSLYILGGAAAVPTQSPGGSSVGSDSRDTEEENDPVETVIEVSATKSVPEPTMAAPEPTAGTTEPVTPVPDEVTEEPTADDSPDLPLEDSVQTPGFGWLLGCAGLAAVLLVRRIRR